MPQYTTTKIGIISNSIEMPFIVILFYIFVEYARPAFLSPARPALIAQVLLVWFLVINREKVIQIFKEKFFKYFLLLLALMILHIFLAVNSFWAYMTFQVMLTYLLTGIAFCVFIDNAHKFKLFLMFFVAIMAFCAIDRLSGIGVLGATGLMGDENDFALSMNVALPISFFLSRSMTSWKKLLFLIASLLFILGNIVSESRGGLIGLAAVGGYCWLYSENKIRTLILVLILVVLAWNFASPEFRHEVSGIGVESADSGTGKDRIELWKVGWRAFQDNPVIGVGQGNMPIVMEKYQYDATGQSYWQRGIWGRAIHSIYFTLLPELGIVGVILVVGMFRTLLSNRDKINRILNQGGYGESTNTLKNLNIAIMASIFGFLVTGFFLSAFYYPQLWHLFALIVSLYLIVSKSEELTGPDLLRGKNGRKIRMESSRGDESFTVRVKQSGEYKC